MLHSALPFTIHQNQYFPLRQRDMDGLLRNSLPGHVPVVFL